MISVESKLKVRDNSGVLRVKCIKALGGSKKKWSKLGSFILVTIGNRNVTETLKQKIYCALILETKKMFARFDGSYLRFRNNGVVLLHPDKKKLVGTRIFGPIPIEFRSLNIAGLLVNIKTFI